ncbi:MAG: Flagellar P-ring protein precursor [bacterium ADurb.Bin429]|nr:MAG: Flagellar P-ring protein precursor [bacterium ADurb.Bin429]
MRTLCMLLTIITLAITWAETPATIAPVVSRVKDLARIQGVRENQLLGYGLVLGLNGTGDTAQTQFTTQALENVLQRMGVTLAPGKLKVKNVAAVMVTADIPAFAKSGDRLDVTVTSIGDATSLQGGVLLQTPLAGADGRVYAVAQGSLTLGGFSVESGGSARGSGHPTVGRIPGGALVEAEIPTAFNTQRVLTFALKQPDFTTAARLAAAVNAKYSGTARARDAATIDVTLPAAYQEKRVEFIAALGELTVAPDTVARVVINERTGTVVVGGTVTVLPVALAQGNLTISINAALLVSQPEALSGGDTVALPTADIEAKEPRVSFAQLKGGTVEELVRILNAMKVSAREIIAILQALKQAGALQAELVIL